MQGKFFKKFCHRIFWGALIVLFLVSPSFSQGQSANPEPLSIQKIEVTESTGGPRVAIEGSKPFEYTVFKLANPLRIVVDLPEAKLGKLAGPLKVQNGIVNVIQNKQIDDPKKPRARVEIGLDQPIDYNVDSEGNYLFIVLSRPPAASPITIKQQEVKPEVKKEEPQAEQPQYRADATREHPLHRSQDFAHTPLMRHFFNHQTIRSCSDSRLGHRCNEFSASSGMAGVNKDREMRCFSQDGYGC